MPNPTRKLKTTDRLTKRQKTLVARIRRQGLKPVVYRRAGNRNKLSVHNPFLDIIRKSKKPLRKRYPQASDNKRQGRLVKDTRKALSKQKFRIRSETRDLYD